MKINFNLKNHVSLFVLIPMFLSACEPFTNSSPTLDVNFMQTAIAETFTVAQAQTLTANPTFTLTPESTPIPTLVPTSTSTSTPVPTISLLSPMETVVDGYLTALENREWAVAYSYLCPQIQEIVPTPDDMARYIFSEMGYNTLPTGHVFLGTPIGSNLVKFSLHGQNWAGGPYEARVDEASLKVCGAGLANGDLRHLLLPGGPVLNIAP